MQLPGRKASAFCGPGTLSMAIFNRLRKHQMDRNRQLASFKSVCFFFSIFLLLSLWVSPTFARNEDILSTPAIKTNQCRLSALLDIAWAGERLVLVGERGHVIFTDDAGKSWQQSTTPSSVNLNAVYFVTPEKGWAVGHGGVVLHTTNGGENWEKRLDGIIAADIILKAAKEDLAKLKEKEGDEDPNEMQNALWRLEDAERDVSIGPAKPFMDVWFKNEQEGFVVGAFGYFFFTSDGGNTWQDYAPVINNPDGMHLYGISGVKDGDIYITGEAGTVFRSKDGGATWQFVDLSYEGSLFGVLGLPSGQVYIYGLRGNAYRSDDHGASWQHLETNTLSSFFGGLALPDGNALLLGQDGVIIHCGPDGCTRVARKDRRSLTSAAFLDNRRVMILSTCGEEIITLPGKAQASVDK